MNVHHPICTKGAKVACTTGSLPMMPGTLGLLGSRAKRTHVTATLSIGAMDYHRDVVATALLLMFASSGQLKSRSAVDAEDIKDDR